MKWNRLGGVLCCVPVVLALSTSPGIANGQTPPVAALWVMPRGERSVKTTYDRIAHYPIGNCAARVTAQCIETNIVLGLLNGKSIRVRSFKAAMVGLTRSGVEKRPVDDASPDQGQMFFEIRLNDGDNAKPTDTLSVSLMLGNTRLEARNRIVFCRVASAPEGARVPKCGVE